MDYPSYAAQMADLAEALVESRRGMRKECEEYFIEAMAKLYDKYIAGK